MRVDRTPNDTTVLYDFKGFRPALTSAGEPPRLPHFGLTAKCTPDVDVSCRRTVEEAVEIVARMNPREKCMVDKEVLSHYECPLFILVTGHLTRTPSIEAACMLHVYVSAEPCSKIGITQLRIFSVAPFERESLGTMEMTCWRTFTELKSNIFSYIHMVHDCLEE